MTKMKTREISINYGKIKKVLRKSKMKLKNISKSSRNKLLTPTQRFSKTMARIRKEKI